jgi:hypothetical protein
VSNVEEIRVVKKFEEGQKPSPRLGWAKPRMEVAVTRRNFCTPVHRFAQEFGANLIDGAKGKYYFASQIEPGSLRTLRINLEGAASLIAVASRD